MSDSITRFTTSDDTNCKNILVGTTAILRIELVDDSGCYHSIDLTAEMLNEILVDARQSLDYMNAATK